MTKREAQNYAHLCERLQAVGFDYQEIETLIRCEKTLNRWSERECNGEIERNEETGKPFAVSQYHAGDVTRATWPIADKETGAQNRAKAIAAKHGFECYFQTDPRGCALYLYQASKLPEGKCITGYYSSIGIAICY